MEGLRRYEINDCDVGDFVYYSNAEYEIGQFLDELDENENFWVAMPEGDYWRFVVEETDDDQGFRLRRIEAPRVY